MYCHQCTHILIVPTVVFKVCFDFDVQLGKKGALGREIKREGERYIGREREEET